MSVAPADSIGRAPAASLAAAARAAPRPTPSVSTPVADVLLAPSAAGPGKPPRPRQSPKPWMLCAASEDEPPANAAPRPPAADATNPQKNSRLTAPSTWMSARWAFVPNIITLTALFWVMLSHDAARPVVALAATASAATMLVLWVGLLARTQQIQGLARLLQEDESAASGRRCTAPHLAAELAPLGRAIVLHMNRLHDLMRRSHDKGVQLGTRLAESTQRYLSRTVEQCEVGVLVLDDVRRVLLANAAARTLLGMPAGDLQQRPLAELVSDAGLAERFNQAQAALVQSRRTVEHVANDRALRITLTSLAAGAGSEDESSLAHAGQITIAYIHDATRERRQAQATADFVSHVAHELRTPLSSLRAYVEMLADGEAADEKTRHQYYEVIQTETSRMSRLIDETLNIARIESGVVKVSRTPVALALVVQDVLQVMQPQAEQKKIRLIGELAPVMHEVHADRDMIHEALLNLVSNAVKYTPEGGMVTVRMRVNDQDRTLTTDVVDTGVGIPAEDLPRMFEKFFRPKANAKFAKGTGLGLNLVRHIVETLHDGKVGLVSVQGKGSTFSITLPLM